MSPPAFLEAGGVGRGDLLVVDYARNRRPQGLDAGGVGFDLLQPLRPNHLQPLYSVGSTALVEVVQPPQFLVAGSNYDLAALLIFDFVFVAKAQQGLDSRNAELGLLGIGTVVNAGMNHPAVVARLVTGNGRFFLHHRNPPAGKPALELHGGGEADDSAADNHHVIIFRVHRAFSLLMLLQVTFGVLRPARRGGNVPAADVGNRRSGAATRETIRPQAAPGGVYSYRSASAG